MRVFEGPGVGDDVESSSKQTNESVTRSESLDDSNRASGSLPVDENRETKEGCTLDENMTEVETQD